MNWKDKIAQLVYVKQVLAEADVEGLFPHHFPNVAASEQALADAAAALGFALDEQYADFLRHADGWSGFYQAADLFGTGDLIGGERMRFATMLLNALDESTLEQAGLARHELLPIAATTEDIDLFCIGKPNSAKPGTVFWFAGTVIDTFPDFDEYYLSMVDYNRRQIELVLPPARG